FGVDVTSTTIRLKRSDDDLQNDQFPVPIPLVGTEYSWRKSLLLVVTAPPDNSIGNLRFFSDGGSLGVGRTILFGRRAAYLQASVADETTAVSAVDATTLTSVSPEVLQPGQLVSDTDPVPTQGTGQDVVELQLAVDPTALVGNSAAAIVFRFRYNES
ncbi:hypothetical protein LCGC14_3164250, partial [marine sediment metagenome]